MVLELFKLNGKTAVVTGANTGLGQGISVALAQAGANVIGVARRSCSDTLDKIEKTGGTFTECIVDLASEGAVEKIIGFVEETAGAADILVNNAGIIIREDAVDVLPEDWDKVIYLNQTFVFRLSQQMAKRFFMPKRYGKIINIASMLSYQGGVRVPAYAASKSAVMGITKALANEWAEYNINVNAIAPGYMATNNTNQLRSDGERNHDILSRIPAGRWGTPEDMAGTAVYLASDASAYVNGFTVAVDGGWLAR